MDDERNVLGEPLEPCGTDPITGVHRDGYCLPGPGGVVTHTICAVVTDAFLDHQQQVGNDLRTPRPEYDFAGLVAGDRWCVVANRWLQAYEADCAPPVVLAATHARAVDVVPLPVLRGYAADVPDDPSALL